MPVGKILGTALVDGLELGYLEVLGLSLAMVGKLLGLLDSLGIAVGAKEGLVLGSMLTDGF